MGRFVSAVWALRLKKIEKKIFQKKKIEKFFFSKKKFFFRNFFFAPKFFFDFFQNIWNFVISRLFYFFFLPQFLTEIWFFVVWSNLARAKYIYGYIWQNFRGSTFFLFLCKLTCKSLLVLKFWSKSQGAFIGFKWF